MFYYDDLDWKQLPMKNYVRHEFSLCIPANNGKSSHLYKHYFEDTEKRKENKGSRVQGVFQNNHSFNL